MRRIGLATGLLAALLPQPGHAAADPAAEQLFAANCAACHQRNGRGIARAFPALAGDALAVGAPDGVVHLLLNGRGGMPSFRARLDDAQLAAVASYVRSAWGNQADAIPPDAFTAARTAQAGPPAEDRDLQAH